MTIWSPEIDESGPVYLAITRALESDIESGRLSGGQQLPTHRELAAGLGVNVGTVTRAYSEARRRGLIEGEVGRGTFVRRRPISALAQVPTESEEEGEDGPIDLSINLPTALPGPDLRPLFESLSHSSRLEAVMDYSDPMGAPAVRQAGALWLRRLGISTEAEGIAICSGAQHAILVALGSVAAPGELVLGEALTYPGFLGAARMLGLRTQGVAIDSEGLIPESLEEICRRERPRVIYCMPSLQNPTCAQLPTARRQSIARIAEKYDLAIVQDEIQGGTIEDPAPSLAELAPDRVLTIASLSKTLSPGLRIAFLAGTARRMERLSELIWSSTWMASPIGAEIARRLIEADAQPERTGDRLDPLLAARRQEIDARHELAAQHLAGLEVRTRPGSYQLWVPLPDRWDNAIVTATLAREGVKVSSADEFRIEGMPPVRAIRVSVSAVRSRSRLAEGFRTLSRVLRGDRQRTPLV